MPACTSNQQLNNGATVNRFVLSAFFASTVVLTAAPASAQGYNPFQTGPAGGIAFPTADLGNVANTGYDVAVMVGYKSQDTPIGVRAEAAYNQFGSKVFNGNVSIPSFTGNLVFGLPTGMLSPYAIGASGRSCPRAKPGWGGGGGGKPLRLQHRWRIKDSSQHQLRDIHRSPLQSRDGEQRQFQLHSGHPRSSVLEGTRAQKKASPFGLAFFASPLRLLHRVDHVEDREIHGYDHASDDDAEEDDHDRLEQREQVADRGV